MKILSGERGTKFKEDTNFAIKERGRGCIYGSIEDGVGVAVTTGVVELSLSPW